MNQIETINYLKNFKSITDCSDCYDVYATLSFELLFNKKFNSTPNEYIYPFNMLDDKYGSNKKYIVDRIALIKKLVDMYGIHNIELLYSTDLKKIKTIDYDFSDYLNFVIVIPTQKIILDLDNIQNKDDLILVKPSVFYNNLSDIIPLLEILDNPPMKEIQMTKLTNNVSIIIKDNGEYIYKDISISKPFVDINLHYNDDFVEANNAITKFLAESEQSGLIMLNGTMGTGKTTYIRNLINTIPGNYLYLTKDMVNVITDPSFITFLINNKNCTLIIEDCESLLMARDEGNNEIGISNLLNMCDGFLSDILKFKVIVTFNTDISKIDQALLRKGRLIYKYQFNKLSVDKSNALLKSLEYDYVTDKSMALSDIFNLNYNNNTDKNISKSFGFN